eukprot:720835-Amorphochlora_amoeboformis.AAC.2
MKRGFQFKTDEKENFGRGNKQSRSQRHSNMKAESSDEESLASQLECPICMNCYTLKVFVCANGHSLCETCYEKIKNKCPSCRTPLKGARNRALEHVITHTVLPCRFREYGCDFKGRGSARSAHRRLCVHRPIKCLFHRCYPTCTWFGPPSELLEHLNSHCVVRRVALLMYLPQNYTSDVYWSYETKERCWQRGKDATFFLPSVDRFYYVSISRQEDHFHLVVVWLPTTEAAAQDLRLIMELTIPLEKDQSIKFTIKPPRLDSKLIMDENVKRLIQDGQSYIIPIRKWR